jgi:glycosyltransferase involved in cell wall biosynthesis
LASDRHESAHRRPDDRLTVVVAAFNEPRRCRCCTRASPNVLDGLAGEGIEGRVLYVDDGSRDGTWEVMRDSAADCAGWRCCACRAISARSGADRRPGPGGEGAALILDADGQDPPELIPQFVAKWREGYDDVHGTRVEREGEGWLKRATAARLLPGDRALSKTPVPPIPAISACCRRARWRRCGNCASATAS